MFPCGGLTPGKQQENLLVAHCGFKSDDMSRL